VNQAKRPDANALSSSVRACGAASVTTTPLSTLSTSTLTGKPDERAHIRHYFGHERPATARTCTQNLGGFSTPTYGKDALNGHAVSNTELHAVVLGPNNLPGDQGLAT